jgi:hypothetical protein
MANILDGNDVVWHADRSRPVKVRGEFTLGTSSSADLVKGFLSQHSKELQLPFPVEGLKLSHETETSVRKVYRFDPMLDGIPVYGAELIVAVDKQHRVRQVDVFAGNATIIRPAANAKRLDSAKAAQAAAKVLGQFTKRLNTPAPTLVWFSSPKGLRHAFRVLVATSAPTHDWEIFVDAYTGEKLQQRDLIKEMPDGTGKVFDPNPVVTANNSALRDPSATAGTCGFAGTPQATIDAQQIAGKVLKDLTLSAGKYKLDGPFCRIHNFAAPASAIPEEATGTFNYPSNDDRFEAVMVYYHLDTYQRYLQSIGITDAHPGVIQADPHDNSITAAWYSPFDGGLHFSDSGPCRPDRAEDADCMIHEYGHAIQDYQVPGWGGTNPGTGRDETGAMGEGFGDFAACAYFSDRGAGFQREVFEDWIFGPGGLRRVDGTKHYPADWDFQVHADGEIWSAALWNIYRAIGGDSAIPADHEAARRAMLRSVIESHPLVAANGTMPDGAEAVMTTNADLDEYRGKHLMAMLDSFHDRGILPVAAGADLYIRDDAADPGTESYHAGTFWDSPDVWIRNHDDGGLTHEEPKAGHDNWFYARVRNRGSAVARAFVVNFNVKLWLGTEFTYPNDFINPIVSAAPGFNLAVGSSMIVKAKWPGSLVPAAGSHGCVLVSVYTPQEHVPASTHVWDHGNLAQKNLHVVAADAGDTVTMPFRFGNRFSQAPQTFRLEIRRSNPELKVSLVASPVILKKVMEIKEVERIAVGVGAREGREIREVRAGANFEPEFLARDVRPITAHGSSNLAELQFEKGRVAGLPIALPARTDLPFRLQVDVPRTAKSGSEYVVDLVQRNAENKTVGGIRLKVVVR